MALLAVLVLGAGCGGGDDREVGTCLERVEGDSGSELEAIDCDRPHELEVVGIVDAGEIGAQWPGAAELSRWAFQRCAEAFEDYVGEPYASSPLDLELFAPSQEEWQDGQREVVCAAGDLDGQPSRGSITDG